MEQNMLVRKLGIALAVFVFLLPVFFVPVVGVSLYVAKIALLATSLVVLFAVFLSSVLSGGMIEIPKARYLLPMVLFAVVSLMSSAFSGSINNSIAGAVFDLGTSGLILMLVFAMFLTVVAAKSIGIVTKVVRAFIYGVLALTVYTIIGTFGSSLLPTALASKIPLFLLGGVIDTAIILGAATILSLCILNMTEVSKRVKIVLSLLMAYSMLFVGAANFTPVIIILGLVSLVFFVYTLSWSVGRPASKDGHLQDASVPEDALQETNTRNISLSSLVILVASIILILGGTGISASLSETMRTQMIEVRPNFQTTMDLTLDAWQENFVLGIGPNRFAQFWALHKPLEINQTQFWNSDFYAGSGFLPTIAITTGLLGTLSFLAFFALYLLCGIKAMFAQANALRSRYLSASSFLVSLYLWVLLFLYTPSIVVLALAFIFTGLFTATLVPQGIVGYWKINIFSNPKTNFLSVLSTVVLLILSIAGGYFVWERVVAAVIFEKGVLQYQSTGNLALARESTLRAASIVPHDVYWRGLTEIYLIDLSRVLGGITGESNVSEAVKTEAQGLIVGSIDSAKKAVAGDTSNFQNWFALGRVYEILATNNVEGALPEARVALEEALKRAPNNPAIPLALGRLDAMAGDAGGARKNITMALELKSNYTDAYFTLAQLEASQNNIPAAVRSVEAASLLDPSNSGLHFQLGLLKYNTNDFKGAASAFGRAIELVPDYANAKYFLGLSLERLSRRSEAIVQFEEIQKTNPDNQEIAFIISNLKTGKSPFKDAVLPVDDKPEKRSEPPIDE